MACLLTKKVAASITHFFPSSQIYRLTILSPLLHFSTKIHEREDLHFMVQYLISSFGFSEERALRLANDRYLSRIKTPDCPESVVQFLKDNGLSDKDINSLISWNPRYLSYNVEKTLKPRANALMTAGFGRNIFIELIKCNPLALTRTTTLSVLQFWKKFVNNSDDALLKVIKNNRELINIDINRKIVPRMNLLREYGLSDQQIAHVVMRASYFILRDLDGMKLLLEQAENLGFQRGSGVFVHGLILVSSLKRDTIERKIEFFKSTYNWSEEDVKLAIRKYPNFLGSSEENVKSTMDFLICKVGLDPKSIAQCPIFINLSLKKRLIPRHYVMGVLKSKGEKLKYSLWYAAKMSEKKFVEKFIVPYKEEVPELWDSYTTMCNGKTLD